MSELVQVVVIHRGTLAQSEEESFTVENPVGVVSLPDGAVITLDPLAPPDEGWKPGDEAWSPSR